MTMIYAPMIAAIRVLVNASTNKWCFAVMETRALVISATTKLAFANTTISDAMIRIRALSTVAMH